MDLRYKNRFQLFVAYCTVLCIVSVSFSQPFILWYDEPATDWETQALPIGNGYMGGMVFGGVSNEKIQFNDHTLWTGGPGSSSNYTGNNPSSSKYSVIQNMRALIEQGNYSGANSAARNGLMAQKVGFGAYQQFGDILLDCDLPSTNTQSYRRELDLDSALAKVSFTVNSVQYNREYFASYPDDVMVLRINANQPGKITVILRPQSPHSNKQYSVDNGRLEITGKLSDNDMAFEAQFKVINSGGTLVNNSETISVSNADTVTILMTTGTDYIPEYPTYKGAHPHAKVTADLDAAIAKGYTQLKVDHAKDYQDLFNAISIDLNEAPPAKTTDAQLADYKQSGNNRFLEALFFQYGRYMLIASSRPGTLPANLQGIWNNLTSPRWSADYHVNINMQMNYWGVEVTNIGETSLPIVDFLNMNRPNGENAAQLYFKADGWTMGNEVNIFGFTGMHDWFSSFYFPLAHAWMAQSLWDHFDFTRDTLFLRDQAYPVLKEIAKFVTTYLIPDKNNNNRLVSSPSYSPEHGDFTEGCSGDQQLAWDLLTNTIESSRILKVDSTFRKVLEDTLSKLDPGLRVGRWGQIQEWKRDIDSESNRHRHIQHLLALYPGRQINPYTDKVYMDAVKVSLDALGDDAEGTGWGRAWRSALRARLFDGDHAYKLYKRIMQSNITTNLWDLYPPFQIDANLGAVAAVAEMFLQSQVGVIHLLPALPSDWPDGEITGFMARGAYKVDIKWNNGQLVSAIIRSLKGLPAPPIRVADEPDLIDLASDTRVKFLDGTVPIVQPDKSMKKNTIDYWRINSTGNPVTCSYRFSVGSSSGMIAIYTITGKLVKQIKLEDQQGIARWNKKSTSGKKCAQGLYIFRLLIGRNRIAQKVLIN